MRALLLPVGEDRYALALEDVHEVVEAPHVTPLPHSPPTVLGITNVRGMVVPVLDTGRLLGIGALGAAAYAAVARSRHGPVGLAVSSTPDTVDLEQTLGEPEDRRATGRYDVDGTGVVTLLDTAALLDLGADQP